MFDACCASQLLLILDSGVFASLTADSQVKSSGDRSTTFYRYDIGGTTRCIAQKGRSPQLPDFCSLPLSSSIWYRLRPHFNQPYPLQHLIVNIVFSSFQFIFLHFRRSVLSFLRQHLLVCYYFRPADLSNLLHDRISKADDLISLPVVMTKPYKAMLHIKHFTICKTEFYISILL